jgi:signal peptidase
MGNEVKFPQLIRDLLSTLIIVAVIIGAGVAITGTWPFMVAVESESMVPHMYPGDVVFLLSPDRVGIKTWVEGVKEGYRSFGDFGDVIVYKPNGYGKPIIHRAIAYVHKGEKIPVLQNGKLVYSNEVAENDGYITQGDNSITNRIPDQLAPAQLSPIGEKIKPVKKEWVIGVAKFRIPLIGYIRLLLPI